MYSFRNAFFENSHIITFRTLYIGGNSLSGGIPSEFGQLGALQAFKLGDNNITGTIPTELGNCTKLRRLGLGKQIQSSG